MFAASWRHSSEKGNAGPSGVPEWHSSGFSEMTLRGLGWTPRGQSGWTWFLPWGQPSVGRHGWLRITFPIVEWSYHVTSMKELNIILLLY